MVSVQKTITVQDYLDRYIKENHLNLSRFVQDKLKELIVSQHKEDEYLPETQQ